MKNSVLKFILQIAILNHSNSCIENRKIFTRNYEFRKTHRLIFGNFCTQCTHLDLKLMLGGISVEKWQKWAWRAHFRTGATTATKTAENPANMSFRSK